MYLNIHRRNVISFIIRKKNLKIDFWRQYLVHLNGVIRTLKILFISKREKSIKYNKDIIIKSKNIREIFGLEDENKPVNVDKKINQYIYFNFIGSNNQIHTTSICLKR